MQITTPLTALRTLLRLRVVSPKSVQMASGRRHSKDMSVTSKGFATDDEEVAKINKAVVED